MTTIALIREDTEATILTLDGIEAASHVYDGQITDHPLSDRSTRADGRILRPRLLSLSGSIAPLAVAPGQLVGASRIEQVETTLREIQAGAIAVSVQLPGRAPIPSMGIERFGVDHDRSDNPRITVDLKEVLTASTRRIVLASPAATAGAPTDQYAAGQAEVQERGTRPTSALASGSDTLLGLLGL